MYVNQTKEMAPVNTPSVSQQTVNSPPTNVMDKILNNLLLGIGECGVPFLCLRSQDHSEPEW